MVEGSMGKTSIIWIDKTMKNPKLQSPFRSWIGRFQKDYWFYPSSWIPGFIGNLWGIPKTLIIRFPARIKAWFVHLYEGVRGAGGWMLAGRDFPLESFGMWWFRLLSKTLDLISFGEIVNAIAMAVKFNARPLSAVERREARKVFGDGLDYGRVRIDEWSLIAHIGNWVYKRRSGAEKGDMAITVFNTINMTRRIGSKPGNLDMAWLIHELTHVAQHQSVGSQFMVEALIAQGREGYDYGGPENLSGRGFASFNREQQGDIARDYYLSVAGRKELNRTDKSNYERVIDEMRRGVM